MRDIERARALLSDGGYTCVICKGEELYFSHDRGVKPLVKCFEENGRGFSGGAAADKVVGKGAAFVYLLLGVKRIYAGVVSRAAKELLASNGICLEYDTLVENIANRKGDGICPFEEAVLCIDDREKAYEKIKEKMKELRIEWNK